MTQRDRHFHTSLTPLAHLLLKHESGYRNISMPLEHLQLEVDLGASPKSA